MWLPLLGVLLQEMADLFISDRTLYVIPYSTQQDPGTNVKTLVARVFHVLAQVGLTWFCGFWPAFCFPAVALSCCTDSVQVTTAVFLVVGVMDGSGKKVTTSHNDLRKRFSEEVKKMEQTLRDASAKVKE